MRELSGVVGFRVGVAFGVLTSLAVASCGKDESTPSSGGAAASGGSAGSGGSSGSAGTAGAGDAAPSPNLSFRKLTLNTEFYCEGASFGDFDRDGVKDVVSGPYWYRGPDFQQKHELYPPVLADAQAYSDNFFAFTPDLSGDGWDDVLIVAFPGHEAFWFENPQTATGTWTRHLVFNGVDTESPDYVDLTGDGRAELVFATGGQLVWAEPDASDPRLPWTIHRLSPPVGFAAFTHGLGVGDVDGDGRADVLEATGFWRQPPALGGFWEKHEQAFGSGGAQMFAIDVDRDGDRDVVTTISAHFWGLSWFEQQPSPAGFVEHVIVSDQEPTTGLVMHEPHALAVHDLNGDGREDLVTGERFMGHPAGWDAGLDGPARLYWFEWTQNGSRVEYLPHLVDDKSGIGTQVVAGDVSGDGLPDLVVANKKGTFVFVQERNASTD